MKVEEISERTSKLIWDWMKVTNRIPHARASETGLTSYLMYSLCHSNEYGKNSGKLFTFDNTKKPESITGADFYLVISNGSRVGKYLIQAKKMYPKSNQDILLNKYNEFDHKIKRNQYQFNIFKRYCAINSYEALYCFYNSIFEQPFNTSSNSIFNTTSKLMKIDSKYSNVNQDVLGVTLSWAKEIDVQYFSNSTVRRITFEESLLLGNTVTMQEFFRNVCGRNKNDMPSLSPTPNTSTNPMVNDSVSESTNNMLIVEDPLISEDEKIIDDILKNIEPPTIADVSNISKAEYEELGEKTKKIIDGIVEKNIDYLPILLYDMI